MTTPQTFTASISDKFMSKATRLFNSSNMDIFHELIQNARRAGATTVSITYDKPSETYQVQDNGKGIEDPTVLLTLGESQWESETQRKEDPAGMGVFSLASRNCVIQSKDWSISLTPEHFAGVLPVTPEPASHISGTSITFSSPEEIIPWNFKDNFKYYPIEIIINGTPLKREPFLLPRATIHHFHGLNLHMETSPSWASSTINFHGLTLNHKFKLPGGHRFKIDVIDCPQLELVLPARKELVQNAFLNELEQHLIKLIFEAYLTKPHTFTYKEYQQAHAMGIFLPESIPKLKMYHSGGLTLLEDLSHPAFLDEYPSDLDEVTLCECQSPHVVDFVQPDYERSGYSWYEAIPEYEAEIDSKKFTATLTDTDTDETPNITLTFDYMFEGDFYDIEDITVYIKDTSKTSQKDITDVIDELLYESFSEQADSYDADNYAAIFDDKVALILDEIYAGTDTAALNQITRAIKQHIKHLIPYKKVAVIRVTPGANGITIQLENPND